jgi:hypothetical protein
MRNFSVVKERILQYLDFKGITKYKMYQETGIANGVLSQKNGLNEENILKFLSVYQDISLEWLFYGKEPLLKNTQQASKDTACTNCIEKERIIEAQKNTISTQKDFISSQNTQIQDLRKLLKL